MALFTAVAGVRIYIGNQLPNDAQIVQSGLNTVVGAAAAGDFEFVRQLDRVVAQIKLLVDFFTQSEGVIQAVLAGGSLAGDHRTDQGASAASHEASRSDEFLEGGNVVKVNAPDFHGETGGELYFAAAKFLSGLSQDGGLLRSDLAVDCNHPGVEQIGAFVVQEAQSFDPLDFCSADGTSHKYFLLFFLS